MGQLFIEALTKVGPDLVQGGLDGIEQGLPDMMRPVLGRVVEQVVAVIGESAVSESVRCPHCARPMWLVDRARPRNLQGLVGDYRLRRAYYVCDGWHAFEHLWTVGKAVFGPSSPAATAWVELLKEGLVKQGGNPVLAALSELTAADEAGREEERKAIGYFTENASRMNYPAFIARQLPIGSGAVESTCKVLIEEREKGAGMRWSKTGAQAIATLRALHRSGRWRAFWQPHPQCRRPAVFPRERSPKASSDTPARKAA